MSTKTTTYTVFSCEADDAASDRHLSGLTLDQAARALLERSGRIHEFRRAGAFVTLFVSDADGALIETDIASSADEPAEARREIYERVVQGALALPGPYVVSTDVEYYRSLAKALHDVTDSEADLLVKLRNGHYHTLLDPNEQRLAEALTARGILWKLRQPRKGFASLYRLAAAADHADADI